MGIMAKRHELTAEDLRVMAKAHKGRIDSGLLAGDGLRKERVALSNVRLEQDHRNGRPRRG